MKVEMSSKPIPPESGKSYCASVICVVILPLALIVTALQPAVGRPLPGAEKPSAYHNAASTPAAVFPVYESRLHYVGQVWLAITTWGLMGTENTNRVSRKDREALGIDYSPSFEFPAGTRSDYLYGGGLWVGGIVGTDTLVSIPMNGVSASVDEWNGYDTTVETSSLRGSQYYSPRARAEQEYYIRYADTLVLNSIDELDGRHHRPLHVAVSQRSYAWSDQFSRQFVIIEYWIQNIGTRPINKMAFGIYMDADVLNDNQSAGSPFLDDVSGFLDKAPNFAVPDERDPVNVAWVADNDGDPVGHTFTGFSPTGAVGIRILDAPPVKDFSFNWWLIGGTAAQNWGPVKAGARTPGAGNGVGAPFGDRNRYYVMTNGEVDYGQLFANIDYTAEGWRPRLRAGGCDIADGLDTRQVISCGPTCDPVLPGDSVPFVIAMCGGEPLHWDADLDFDCYDPYAYMSSLDFTSLTYAADWASWVYDNPGVDSDGDGYAGEYHLANCDSVVFGIGYGCDTIYYTGDMGPPPGEDRPECVDFGGRPDFGKPDAPACPELTIETRPGQVIISWDGRFTETVEDRGSGQLDFEGYRLYISRIDAEQLYALVGQWDIEDYVLMYYYPREREWLQLGDPFSLEQLQDTTMFGPGFDPSLYDRPRLDNECLKYLVYDPRRGRLIERCCYLVPAFNNRGNEYDAGGGRIEENLIQRIRTDTLIDVFGDTLPYGVYEAVINNLNGAVGQYVSVTAFDYGSTRLNIQSLETRKGAPACTEFALPVYSADVVEDTGLHVTVYPNPYKIAFEGVDGRLTTYYDLGFEAPEKRQAGRDLDEQDRRIWFINLPRDATIRIYTLDGDLVRTIDHHDGAYTTDYSSRAYWDLVTRNTQAVVSGIYIYRVDSKLGSQTGKIVVVK
jgi:hypothetical protein